MTVLTIILGVLLILGGISCIFTPVATFLSTGYFVGILFLIYGIGGIIRAFQRKSHALDIILSILSVAVGVASILRPGTTLVFDKILLLLVSAYFILQGIITIAISMKAKGVSKIWLLYTILGALGILLGIYSLIHPLVAAVTIGYLIGFYFIDSGISMILLASAADAIKKGLRGPEEL